MYVHVLQSEKDTRLYTGCTQDLKKRKRLHDEGYVESTSDRRPLKLVYYEYCLNQEDAYHREKYLKTTYGKRYIRSRLRHYFTG